MLGGCGPQDLEAPAAFLIGLVSPRTAAPPSLWVSCAQSSRNWQGKERLTPLYKPQAPFKLWIPRVSPYLTPPSGFSGADSLILQFQSLPWLTFLGLPLPSRVPVPACSVTKLISLGMTCVLIKPTHLFASRRPEMAAKGGRTKSFLQKKLRDEIKMQWLIGKRLCSQWRKMLNLNQRLEEIMMWSFYFCSCFCV